jgi:hypothetical protein
VNLWQTVEKIAVLLYKKFYWQFDHG